MTLDEIHEAIAEMDPKEQPWSNGWKAQVILLASTEVGPDIDKLYEFTGIRRHFIQACAERLEANGIWRQGKIYAEWTDPELGETAFFCDVCVALGHLTRVTQKETL